jgi:nucleotide-binding universal stress UspA family protein
MYTKILVPLDGSPLAEVVLPYLEWFIKVSHVNEIVFLRVVEPFKVPGGLESHVIPEEKKRIEKDAVDLAKEYLENIASRFTGSITVKPAVLVGKPVKTVADYVSRCDVDLIIMATHGFSGVHRWFSGSVADEIVHAARAPVFLVGPDDRPPDRDDVPQFGEKSKDC